MKRTKTDLNYTHINTAEQEEHIFIRYKILNCKVDGREGEARRNIIANKFF